MISIYPVSKDLFSAQLMLRFSFSGKKSRHIRQSIRMCPRHIVQGQTVPPIFEILEAALNSESNLDALKFILENSDSLTARHHGGDLRLAILDIAGFPKRVNQLKQQFAIFPQLDLAANFDNLAREGAKQRKVAKERRQRNPTVALQFGSWEDLLKDQPGTSTFNETTISPMTKRRASVSM